MIDYKKLADSVSFYSLRGFKQIEAPWWISKEIIKVTFPSCNLEDFYLSNRDKYLVASGEQSFLYLMAKGLLPPGRYQTITPCFRDEAIDVLHRKAFMKNELIITDHVNSDTLHEVVHTAMLFFQSQVPDPTKINLVETEEGYDINYGSIELGSYGIRKWSLGSWIYATGCAEPRLTHAISCEHS